MAVAARPDETALASLAIVTAAIADDNVLLADVGPYTKRENGDTVAHPATRRLAANLQRQQALMNEFGLTPASRSKVAALNPNTENPFANLDRI